MLMGGEEADLLWNATVDAFVAGQLGGDTPVRSGDVRAGTAGLVANDAAPGPPWPCRLPARTSPERTGVSPPSCPATKASTVAFHSKSASSPPMSIARTRGGPVAQRGPPRGRPHVPRKS